MSETTKSTAVLAGNLRRLCQEKGMTHCELAKRSGCTVVSISRYCNGWRMPNAFALKSLAEVLECRMEDLLEEHAPEPQAE